MSAAIELINDVLRSSEPQLRRNASTGLAALATDESLAQLARVALDDPDESVRAWAEKELGELHGADARCAGAVLIQAVHEPESRLRAYALLGRLTSRSWERPRARLSVLRRLRLVLEFHHECLAARNEVSRSTVVWRGVVGVTAAALMLVVAMLGVLGALPEAGELLLDMLGAYLVVGALLWAISSRAVPIRLHYDRAAAASLALAGAGLAGAVAGGVFVLLWAAADSIDSGQSASVVSAMTLLCIGARGGALLPLGVTRHVTSHRYAQALCGTVVALIGASIAFWGRGSQETMAFFVVTCALSGVGLANGFATIDEKPPSRPLFGRAAKAVVVVVMTVIIAATLLLIMRSAARVSARSEAEVLLDDGTRFHQIQAEALPLRLAFKIETPREVTVALTEKQPDHQDVALLLIKEGQPSSPMLMDDPDPPTLTKVLEPGRYIDRKSVV